MHTVELGQVYAVGVGGLSGGAFYWLLFRKVFNHRQVCLCLCIVVFTDGENWEK